LAEGTPVMKLVGPILVNVDLADAQDNVAKRLKFIEEEVAKVERSID